MPPYTENRKAHFDYETLEKYEGGLQLTGAEVKSVREGGARLDGSYLKPLRGELWLVGAQIRRYSKSNPLVPYDPSRSRKVLVHAKELAYLAGKTQQKGLTLVPFSLYPSGRRIKVSFGVCRGKKSHDKREAIKQRDSKRQVSKGEW